MLQLRRRRCESRGGKTRVLIASASIGMGHVSAGKAIELQLKASYPDIEVCHADSLEYLSRPVQKLYRDAYFKLVAKAPMVVGWLYQATDKAFRSDPLREFFEERTGVRFRHFVEDFQPDITICTHFTPAALISKLAQQKRVSCPITTVVTDFDVHGLWMQEPMDHYFVATEAARHFVAAHNVPIEQTTASGIPTRQLFHLQKSRAECAAVHGIDPNLPTVLISAGGFGGAGLAPLLEALLKIEQPVQFLMLCGKHAKVQQEIEQRLRDIKGGPVFRVFGFTEHMDELMSVSDFILGKPGGLTTWESFGKGLGWVILNPIPGQEERNTIHLLEAGAGIFCPDLLSLPYKLGVVLSDQAKLSLMRKASKSLARPDAAERIVKTSLKLIGTSV